MALKAVRPTTTARVETIRLEKWHRQALYATTLLVSGSGLLWLVAHFALRRHGEFGDLPSPLEGWMLKVHGLGILAALFLYGSLLKTHMLKAWQMRRNHRSGLVTVSLLFILLVTGYLLYYFSSDALHPILSVAHWVPGIALILGLPFHIWRGRHQTVARTSSVHPTNVA